MGKLTENKILYKITDFINLFSNFPFTLNRIIEKFFSKSNVHFCPIIHESCFLIFRKQHNAQIKYIFLCIMLLFYANILSFPSL